MRNKPVSKKNFCLAKNNHDSLVNQSQFRRAKNAFIL